MIFGPRRSPAFWAGMAAYAVVLFVSISLLQGPLADGGAWRAPVALLPMLPALLVLVTVVRRIAAIDELQRRIQFEALAFSFAATAIVTFSYGFLEKVGFPQATMFWVWPIMATFWILGLAYSSRRYR